MSRPRSLNAALSDARVLVCAGTGGVGKTTVAAALAIAAARKGRSTLVLTIDPARRLANALGLEALGDTPAPVPLPKVKGGSTLHAMMLDPKPTFDRLIKRLTDDPETRRRIFENSIYQHVSEALAGSAEYAAMEQVHELLQSEQYDLIVLDTPPASHALDFLRAPERLRDFFESRFVSALVRPALSASRFGMRLFARPLHRMFGLLERIAGGGFLDDLREFLTAIDGLADGFRERAQRVEDVLRSEATGFVLMTGAQAGSNQSTIEFLDELETFRVRLVGVIVNRMRPWPGSTTPREFLDRCDDVALAKDAKRLRETLSHAGTPLDEKVLVGRVLEYANACAAEEIKFRAVADRAARHRVPCLPVHELPQGIEQIEGLLEIGAHLFSCDAPETREGRSAVAHVQRDKRGTT